MKKIIVAIFRLSGQCPDRRIFVISYHGVLRINTVSEEKYLFLFRVYNYRILEV